MGNTLIWLQEMEDNNESWVNISSVITMLKKEQEEAINYSQCCETLKDNKITFHEFTREFCLRTENDLWLYKGIKYNDLELDLVYKQYINDLNL